MRNEDLPCQRVSCTFSRTCIRARATPHRTSSQSQTYRAADASALSRDAALALTDCNTDTSCDPLHATERAIR